MSSKTIALKPSHLDSHRTHADINSVEYVESHSWWFSIRHSKTTFVVLSISCLVVMLLGADVGLSLLYEYGQTITLFAAAITISIIVLLFLWQSENTFIGLAIGTLLWAVMGETATHYGYADMFSTKNVLLMGLILVLVTYLTIKDVLPWYLIAALILFVVLWSFRFIVSNLVSYLGPHHIATYLTSILFPVIIVVNAGIIWKTRQQRELIICSIFIASSIWICAQFLSTWGWIPCISRF